MRKRLTRYNTGKPCKHGHYADRMLSTRACVSCLKDRKRRPNHKKRALERKRERYATDLEYKQAKNKLNAEYFKTKKGKVVRKTICAKYRLNNKGKIKKLARSRYLRDPSVAKRHYHNRRARLANAKGRFTQADLDLILAKQLRQCLCKASFDVVKPTLDHKNPLSRGGSNWPRNLQFLCQPCNDSKGAKTMREWRMKC